MIFKKQSGFTLVEIIVSVAALSLICALVIRLFLLAGDVNERSEKKQIAIIAASNIMEIIKSERDTETLLENEVFKDYEVTLKDRDIELNKTIHDDMKIRIMFEWRNEVSSPNGDYFDISVEIYDIKTHIYSLKGGVYFEKY